MILGTLSRVSLSVVFVIGGGLIGVTSGCGPRTAEPQVASSASQLGYAHSYPAELSRVRSETETQLQVASTTSESLATFPEELGDTDPALALAVYRRADEEGRAQAYVRSFEEAAWVNRFFAEEKQPIVSRVAGAAQNAAKKKSCDVELYGPAAWSLEKAVGKQLQERLRKRSEAHAQTDAASKELGPKHTEALHSQADQISMASYVVNIRAQRLRRDLENLHAQAGTARDALSEHREDLAQQTEPDKEALKQTDDALAQLDESTAQTEQTLKNLEEQERAAKQAYDRAFEALLEAMEQRSENAAQGSEGKTEGAS